MSNLNPSDYVYRSKYINVPSISLDVYTVTAEQLISLQENYMSQATEYSKFFNEIVEERNYLQNRLMYDLSIETEYLTKEGVNKQINTLDLHVKADNVFKVAKKENISYDSNISNIISNFEELNQELVVDDSSSDSALVENYTSCIYDIKAKTYTLGSQETIFIKDVANAEETSQTFSSYTSVLESGKYVNTKVYTLKYDDLSITNSNTQITIKAWNISDVNNVVYCYTTDDVLTIESPSWISLVEFPSSSEVIESSSSEEEVIESSSSEEEVIGE